MIAMDLGNLLVHLRLDTASYDKSMNSVERKILNTANKMQSLGNTLTMRLTLPLVGLGAAAVKAFGNFDQAMAKSLAIMSDVSDEMKKEMRDVAISLSKETISSATEVAEAYYHLASAGMTAAQAMKAVPIVQRFATAGNFDLEQASMMVATAQMALGMRMEDATENMKSMVRITDVLTQANNMATGEVEDFAKAITNKAGAALKLLDKDIEEGVAVLMAFADQNVRAEEAGERLSMVLRDLQRSAIANKDAWTELGLTVYDSQGMMLPLADIIQQLEKRMGGMSHEQKKMTFEMLGFQDRSVIAVQMLMGMSDRIRGYEKALRSAGGATEHVANESVKNFNDQMRITFNNVKAVGIEIGEHLAGRLEQMNEGIRMATEWWSSLSDATQGAIVDILVFSATLGPLLKMVGILTKGFTLLAAAIHSTFGLIVIAIAAVVSGVLDMVKMITGKGSGGLMTYLYEHFEWMQVGIHNVTMFFMKAWEWIKYAFEIVCARLSYAWDAFINSVKLSFRSWQLLAEKGWAYIRYGFEVATAAMVLAWDVSIKGILTVFYAAIGKIWSGWQYLAYGLRVAGAAISLIWNQVMAGMTQGFVNVVEKIGRGLSIIENLIRKLPKMDNFSIGGEKLANWSNSIQKGLITPQEEFKKKIIAANAELDKQKGIIQETIRTLQSEGMDEPQKKYLEKLEAANNELALQKLLIEDAVNAAEGQYGMEGPQKELAIRVAEANANLEKQRKLLDDISKGMLGEIHSKFAQDEKGGNTSSVEATVKPVANYTTTIAANTAKSNQNVRKMMEAFDSGKVAVSETQAEMDEMLKALDFEYSMLGKINSERERGVALAEYEKLAAKELGQNTKEYFEAMERYSTKLDQIMMGQRGFPAFQQKMKQWVNDSTDYWNNLADIATNSLDRVADTLTELVMTGKADWAELSRSIVADFLRMIIRMQMASLAANLFPGMMGGPMAGGMAGGGGGGLLSGLFGWLFHKGGIVGQDGQPVLASASMFSNAPRFHNGLGANEFPAILERGERVIPKGQTGEISSPPNVIINNKTGYEMKQDGIPQWNGHDWVVGIIVKDINQNGPLKTMLRNNK